MHTINVRVDVNAMSDRAMERLDAAVAMLRDIPGVSVTGWCDDDD